MITHTTITNLTTTISADAGFDEVLTQFCPVTAECWMDGKRIVKVTLPDGIKFAGPSGYLVRPDGFDATDLCDLVKLARQIEMEAAERAYFRIERRVMDRAIAQLPEFARTA